MTDNPISQGNTDQEVKTPPAAAQDTSSHTGRKWAVGLLIFLGTVFLILANLSFWAWFTLLNTNGWVAAVGPLTQDPAVSAVISQYVVSEVFEDVDVEATIDEALPPEFQALSGPLVVGLEQLADQAVTAVVVSDGFNNVWVGLNRAGHTAVMKVLKGEGDRLYFQDGNLVLDLNDVYNYVENQFGLTDMNLVPQAEEGRLVLFSSYQVAVMQEMVSYMNALGLLLPLLTIVVFGVAVWVSLWRRQTLIWIGGVMAVAMLISLIVFAAVRSNVLINVPDAFLRELGRAIIDVLTHGLMVQTLFMMIVGIGLAIGGWQAAPDSAFMQWEASRKENEAAKKASEDASA